MIPKDQIEMIDTDTNVASVLRVLAANGWTKNETIQYETGLTFHQVKSALVNANNGKYAEMDVKIDRAGTRSYKLLRMNSHLSRYRKGVAKERERKKRQDTCAALKESMHPLWKLALGIA